jgi:outer membrane protein OmpA-like peptidoglycan-associated protein
MNIRSFALLFVSSGLALSSFAQQAAPSAPAGQSASASAVSSPLPPPDRGNFWDGDDPSLAALIFHPFASKAYVKRHVQPIRDRLMELDELTVENSRLIKDVDSRAQQGLKLASDKSDLADQHATDASSKALAAQQTATALNSRIGADESVVGNIDQYKSAAPQTEIVFRRGQTMLSKQAKDALDQMAAPLKDQHGYILEVQGFSAGKGQAAIASSRKMADSVVRYLVLNHEIPTYRIYVLGMGNAATEKGTSPTRVDVSVLKNDTVTAQR